MARIILCGLGLCRPRGKGPKYAAQALELSNRVTTMLAAATIALALATISANLVIGLPNPVKAATMASTTLLILLTALVNRGGRVYAEHALKGGE